jgi:hypothetical protein
VGARAAEHPGGRRVVVTAAAVHAWGRGRWDVMARRWCKITKLV